MSDFKPISKQVKRSWASRIFGFAGKMINFLAPNRFLKIFAALLFMLPLTIILYYLVLQPVQQFPDRILASAEFGFKPNVLIPDHEHAEWQELGQRWNELNRQYETTKSLLQLARGDSIYLVMDLRDSTLNLVLKGVKLRRCRLSHLQMSRSISVLNDKGLLAYWAGEPFTLQSDWASIEKNPLQIKEAPKDTLEALKYLAEPVVPPVQDVHVSLRFDRYLIIHINQVQPTSWHNWDKRLRYELDWLLVSLTEKIEQLKNRTRGKPALWIHLDMDRDNALALYRAIPTQAKLVIQF